MTGISELRMGKVLTVYHHGIEKFHYDGFEINSERDIKSCRLIISSLMRSLEKLWKASNKI